MNDVDRFAGALAACTLTHRLARGTPSSSSQDPQRCSVNQEGPAIPSASEPPRPRCPAGWLYLLHLARSVDWISASASGMWNRHLMDLFMC